MNVANKALFLVFCISAFVFVKAQPLPRVAPRLPSNYQSPVPERPQGINPAISGNNTLTTTPNAIAAKDSADKKTPRANLLHSADSTIKIGVILPFEASTSLEKLYASMTDKDGPKVENNKLREANNEALDFFEGLKYAINNAAPKGKISFYVFDSYNSDSVVQELVKNDSLKQCDLIIGPTTAGQAKIIATFCKNNRIINIQPFVASKSFATENPYLVRFMPTIDAHLQKEYEMVTDSFSDANIIVYTTKKERDLSAARQLDTLFKAYNAVNTHKLKYTFLNSGDSSIPAPKRVLSYYLSPKEQNIVLMTCYDEAVVNAQLRTIKDNTIVFGMPTWIEAEQIRPDYLSKAEPYFTDNYYVDTAKTQVKDFISSYTEANNQKPSRYAYMGYDAMRYLTQIFNKYGKNLKLGFDNESYDGLGFCFHISPYIKNAKANGEPVINYYSNTAMHLFQVSDYKIWLVR